jgi:hypothetical protein
MSIDHEYDESLGFVRITWRGKATIADWAETMDLIRGDPRFRPGLKFLSDRRPCTAVPTDAEIQASVDYFTAHQRALGHTKWAVIVTSVADYGMMRMGETLAGPLITLAYFENEERAEQWVISARGG